MRISPQLKDWLVEHRGLGPEASDDDVRREAAAAMVDGDLSPETYRELVEADAKEANAFAAKLEEIAQGLKALTDAMAGGANDRHSGPAGADSDGGPRAASGDATGSGPLSKMVARLGGDGGDVRVKGAHEAYDSRRKTLVYPPATKAGRPHQFAGEPVRHLDRTLNEPSDLDKALAGAWAKFQIASCCPRIAGTPQRAWEMLSEHEKGLLEYLAEHESWDGLPDGRRAEKGYPGGVKALIDDSVSGGLEAAPIVFDDQVIQTPLLHGELFPLVNVVPLDRGRRVEGVVTGTVTGSWGGVDDTAVTLFNTASYVSAFDTTIFRWEGAIRIGLDFLSDTPIDFGAHITAQYGERLLEDLDDVIASGNGTSQPEGVINHSGTTSVSFGGSTTIGNYESLRFGVSKAEHRGAVGRTAVFCGTETSYQRAKAINVGSSDARRLFAYAATTSGDYDDYALMGRPYKINESLTNQQIFYAVLGRYRMYRRRGLSVRTSTEGDTLLRRNEMLIVAMARYGGQLERGAAAAVTSDAPA